MDTARLLFCHPLHQFDVYQTDLLRLHKAIPFSEISTKLSVRCSSGNPSNFTRTVGKLSPKAAKFQGVLKDSSDFSWVNRKIKEISDNGHFEDALRVFIHMLERGFPPERFTFFPNLIKCFARLRDVDKSRQIHGFVLKLGFLDDNYVANAVTALYFECGYITDAVKVFDRMPDRDTVSWNTVITGFCQFGDHLTSLSVMKRMIQEDVVQPNHVTCHSVLSLCASINSLIHGKEIHGYLLKSGLNVDEFLVVGLIDMYLKCGDAFHAESVFESLDEKATRGNTMIWNVMIKGYVSNKCFSQAFKMFIQMLELGILPDSSTVVAVLILCSEMEDLSAGKQVHKLITSFELERDARVETSLMNMYLKCGDPETGLKIFTRSANQNSVMFSTVISDFVQNGFATKALDLFQDFMSKTGFPDPFLLSAVLRACSLLKLASKGKEIHGFVVKLGLESDAFIGTALVDMYGKFGDMKLAKSVFSRLPSRDLVTWNALISGFSQKDCVDEAVNAFRDMLSEQVRPNAVTVASVLSVSAHLSAMNLCKELHCYSLRFRLHTNLLVNNSLISCYSKCGNMKSSWTVFQKMQERDQISWNSLILGYGMHGCTEKMFALYEKMINNGMEPDNLTFTALLSACSHTGKLKTGLKIFESMVADYKIEPELEHYTCLVDLLGRAGHLKQAYEMIMSVPFEPDGRLWGSLLGSCKTHGDEKMAETVARHLFRVEPESTGYRVLVANLYEEFGDFAEVCRMRSEIKEMGLKKQPGCSWIEVRNQRHVFTAADCSHPQSVEMYNVLESLTAVAKSLKGEECMCF